MSRSVGGGRGSGSGVARGASYAAAKGAGLVGLAVVIGIVLLQVTDDGTSGPADADQGSAATTTTVADDGGGDTGATTTTTAAAPAKTPDQLKIVVLNGGARTGAAREMAEALQGKGYTNQLEPTDWADHEQTGNSVHCAGELSQEAAALAVAVGEGTPVQDFPEAAPAGTDGADCLVVVGAAG